MPQAVNVDRELEELKQAAARWYTFTTDANLRQLCEAAVTFTKAVEKANEKLKGDSVLERWKREGRG